MGIVSAAGWAGKQVARRSKWLAKRLWIVSLVEVALLARRHWIRLEPDERERLTGLIRKSRGRPSHLSDAERRELEALLDKLGHLELARDAFARALPIGGSVVRRLPLPGRTREESRQPAASKEKEKAPVAAGGRS